jgi:membrane fusion protein (multidrug efflux system)
MKLRTIIIIIVSVVVVGFLIYNKVKSSAIESKKNAPPSPEAMKKMASQVSACVISPEKLDNHVISSGTVLANNEVQLYSEISGKITHIYFSEGGKVTKGQLLVKINDADLQAQLAKSKAIVKINTETNDRNYKLLQKQGLSQQEYDQGLSMLDQAKADIAFLQAQIAKTEIRSPYTGVIGLKNISEGSFLSPTVKIATIQEIEPVKIDFSIPEKYMNIVKTGDEVKFTIQGSRDTFNAKIYAMEPKIDLATRSLMVRAVCPNHEKKVLPGAFAQVELILKQIENAIMIPTQSVIPILKGQQVYISKNGRGQPVKVQTGVRNDSTIQITNGLHPGDTVITTGIMMLKPGVKLQIKTIRK